MLDKSDKKWITETIKEIIGSSISGAFSEFYETIFAPYVDQNEKLHKETQNILAKHSQQLNENRNDHEKIFRSLERNREKHGEMFARLDKIENGLKGHEKRITELESASAI